MMGTLVVKGLTGGANNIFGFVVGEQKVGDF